MEYKWLGATCFTLTCAERITKIQVEKEFYDSFIYRNSLDISFIIKLYIPFEEQYFCLTPKYEYTKLFFFSFIYDLQFYW